LVDKTLSISLESSKLLKTKINAEMIKTGRWHHGWCCHHCLKSLVLKSLMQPICRRLWLSPGDFQVRKAWIVIPGPVCTGRMHQKKITSMPLSRTLWQRKAPRRIPPALFAGYCPIGLFLLPRVMSVLAGFSLSRTASRQGGMGSSKLLPKMSSLSFSRG
jgi:hypothetical protein